MSENSFVHSLCNISEAEWESIIAFGFSQTQTVGEERGCRKTTVVSISEGKKEMRPGREDGQEMSVRHLPG